MFSLHQFSIGRFILHSLIFTLITCPYGNKLFLTTSFLSLCADYVELTPPEAVTLAAGPAGQTCFTGDIIDDQLALEPVEQFTLRLRDPVLQNVLVGNDETVVRIIDDDGKCACGIVFFIYIIIWIVNTSFIL